MSQPYTIEERNNQLILRTVLYKYGSGSALNVMVYNRDLAALLSAVGGTGLLYIMVFPSGTPGWLHWVGLGVAFVGLYAVFKMMVFAEHMTVTTMDRTSGTVTVTREKPFGRTLTKIIRLAEIRFIEAEEQPAPDESDIQEIVKWHKMAEPGVHSTPLPLYRVSLVLADGSRVLIYTDIVQERVQELRLRLGEFAGLA